MITLTDELAVKLSGKKADELRALLNDEEGNLKDNAASVFTDIVVQKFKDIEDNIKVDRYNKGRKEAYEIAEKAFAPVFKKFGIEADRLEDAATELSDKLKKVERGEPGKPGKPQDLTPEEIKKLPAYQSLLDDELAKVKSTATEWEQKYNSYVADMQRKEVLSIARDRALSLLEKKGAVWGQDKVKQLDYFFRAIGTDRLRLKESGELELVDDDGNPQRDDSRNKVEFDSWLVDNWKAAGYNFHDAPPGSGSAGAGSHGGSGGGSKISINSPEQYNQLINEAGNDLTKKAEIRAAYREYMANQK